MFGSVRKPGEATLADKGNKDSQYFISPNKQNKKLHKQPWNSEQKDTALSNFEADILEFMK